MVRAIGGPSATLSGMSTGDVYGGIARASAVRSYLAVLQYRAAKDAAWAMGVYVRNATFVIEPLLSPPAGMVPKNNIARKMNRIQKTMTKVRKASAAIARSRVGRAGSAVGEGARMVCPLADIIVGVASLPFALFGIVQLIGSLAGLGKPIPIPPVGPPRVRTRYGTDVSKFATVMFM